MSDEPELALEGLHTRCPECGAYVVIPWGGGCCNFCGGTVAYPDPHPNGNGQMKVRDERRMRSVLRWCKIVSTVAALLAVTSVLCRALPDSAEPWKTVGIYALLPGIVLAVGSNLVLRREQRRWSGGR